MKMTLLKTKWRKSLGKIGRIITLLKYKEISYTADNLIPCFQNQIKEDSLFFFMQKEINRLKELGKVRTSETYATTLNSFMRFRKNEDILLEEMDTGMMIAYEAYLKEKKIGLNTISFYMRVLRAVYNRAVEKELIIQLNPFRNVYTGTAKTMKRAIPLKTIKQIKKLDLTQNPSLDYARDLFLFSFYCRGMSFIDMAYLRKRDLQNGVLSYKRKKTGQQLYIKWEDCMQEIIDKYPSDISAYLLPIIKNPRQDERKQYKNSIFLVNRKLKEIAIKADLTVPLTMYVARHSWASIARSKNIPIAVISEGMGHDSEMTTQIYLASLETSVVDRANSLIIKSL